MERYYTIDIIVHNRDDAYDKVNELLHQFAKYIKLRVGYPLEKENMAVIFLIFKANNDKLGSFTGKLGQIKSVKVKSIAITN
ncbi:TM1266 family iron-only hydrogenase system putative regulator [Thermosipho atlanticus]|uniref:Putative iron-only hydrogenase system regulator n=1 Tax=Thermosipho atlanticus DSM 15807 TaxID=1123380 RepID=A0A1M5R846_9BACT|nr:TM1266 family iron-only hydrogenase system putative regulator [Thermosipho atlanticus]SHH22462.1 putative iron-only hydrogenase system regulator [Thermosipho atlanticus DSM 15807]